MSAGTITLTNNSAAVSGTGTAFTTELKEGDFLVTVVGGVPYTMPVKSVNNNTSLVLISNFTGPTQSGVAWSSVPRTALNMVTAALVTSGAEALRGLNYDKQNWQQVFSATGNVTVKLPDGSSFTGPAWGGIVNSIDKKADKTSLGTSSTMNAMVNTVDTSPNTPIMIKGGFGVGGYGVGTSWIYTAEGALVSSSNGAPISGTVHHGIVCAHNSDPAYGFQIAGRFDAYVRFKNAGTFTQWRKVYDNGNTTVTSDGVIKVSSPVINIFHDGKFEINAESEGAVVKREGVGVYRISGVIGMNSDGAWGGVDGGFDIPKDRNGQRLLWLDYKVESDGSILVKTYHRTYPDAPAFARNIKEGYEEGDLIDIPSDQFVSVRVEMPQDSIWNLAQNAAQEEMEQEKTTEE